MNYCTLVELRNEYGQIMNLFAALRNVHLIVKGYDPYSDSESEEVSGSKDGNGIDVGEEEVLEEEAVLAKNDCGSKDGNDKDEGGEESIEDSLVAGENDSVSENGSGNDEGEEEIIEDDSVGRVNDSVSENRSGNDEGEEESVEVEAIGAEKEETLAEELVRIRARLPRGKYVVKKVGESLLSYLFLEVLKRLRKNVIYLQFLQGQIKKR